MIENIQTIIDRKFFKNILQKFFINKPSFIRSKSGNLEVNFIKFDKGLIKIRIPYIVEEPKNCISFTRNSNNVIFAFLQLVERNEDDIYTFNPAKFQVISVERKDERKPLISNVSKKSIIYITNFISEKMINNCLTGQKDKLKRIKEIIFYDHFNEYDYLKMFFSSEDMNDCRMNYFKNNRNPIYITDLNSVSVDEDQNQYYKDTIYSNDSYLKIHNELSSEVSVPILFDSKIPYGYIQVNKTKPLSTSTISIMKRLAVTTDEIAKKSKIFSVSSDKILVSDISSKGVGIVFRNQKYIPYYSKDSYVALDLLLPRLRKASILADVRHLEMMRNKIIKVGFEIKDMDDASRNNYERFLGSVSR